MPELDGLQATRRILATDNTAWILILTTFGPTNTSTSTQRRRERDRVKTLPNS